MAICVNRASELLCSVETDVEITFHSHVFTLIDIGHERPLPNGANSRVGQCGITGEY